MQEVFSVTQFNKLIKRVVQELGVFRVEGEVTELRITSRQGVYITLSDGKSNLKLSGYAPMIKGIDLIEKDMNVIAEGTCDIYVPYGNFSLSIHSIKPEGEGALAIAYDKLKKKLKKEGYFAEEKKIPLPKFVTKIALLTASKSAAFSDFVKILKENKSGIEVDFYPVIVQGKRSVKSILNILDRVKESDYDAIVLTRGGGSLEDLKSFNDEEIARKIFQFNIPVVVGVGHEKDESICDFVADVKASTPSQCAYYLAQQNQKFLQYLENLEDLMLESITSKIQGLENRLDQAKKSMKIYVNNLFERIKISIGNFERILNSYDIENVLKRGFALVQKDTSLLDSIEDLKIGDSVSITLQDGDFVAKVDNI